MVTLEDILIDYSIGCGVATSIAISFNDNKSDSNNNPFVRYAFGLGWHGARQIGFLTVRNARLSSLGDGVPVSVIQRTGAGWWGLLYDEFMHSDDHRLMTFATLGSLVPGAYRSYTGTFIVNANISRSSELDLTDAIVLDGHVTMTIHYL